MFSEGDSKTHVCKAKLTLPFKVCILSPSSFSLKIQKLFGFICLFVYLFLKSGRYKTLKRAIADICPQIYVMHMHALWYDVIRMH